MQTSSFDFDENGDLVAAKDPQYTVRRDYRGNLRADVNLDMDCGRCLQIRFYKAERGCRIVANAGIRKDLGRGMESFEYAPFSDFCKWIMEDKTMRCTEKNLRASMDAIDYAKILEEANQFYRGKA